MKFRDYQEEIIAQGKSILSSKRMLYLAMEVRTGKTLTSLGIAEEMGYQNVLFLTKKMAMLCPSYVLFIINYESIHKAPPVKWDLIICDEAHSMGAYPKPSKRAKQVRELIRKSQSDVIFLSGTPSPESFSQIYHQVYGVSTNPFSFYKNFYRFADDYVKVEQVKFDGLVRNQYQKGLPSILEAMKPYTINYTQKEAGFKVDTKEHILTVPISHKVHEICRELKKHMVVVGKNNTILADTPVKMMQKLHQLYSGTVKFESGESMVIDHSKAEFILKRFAGKKVGIFYKFKAELKALKETFGDDLTTDLEEFNNSYKSIALQIVSGREGISLRKAEALVYYNIDFSATSYWQSRDRMTTKDRLKGDVYWIFADRGIEKMIYKAVNEKKTYTVSHFKKDLLTL